MQKLYKINIEGEEYTVGYPASVLVGQLEEELETLRASNRIKQANIELLEAENEKLEDKLQEQLCTVGSLLEDNAKLIAERDELREQLSVVRNSFEGISWPYHHCYELLKYAGIDFSGSAGESIVYAVKRLLAEREAMMKQEPVAFISPSGDLRKSSQAKYAHERRNQFTPLYAHPILAQQIPEGYALVPIEPTEEMRDAANRVDEQASEKEILSSDHFMNIYKAMLSASQPKGE